MASGARPIPPSKTRPTAGRLWSAAGKIATSFASSWRRKIPQKWRTFAASPATSCARWSWISLHIAVDHHNTGHPHAHIIVRGVLDDGRILNIAGDYIAHCIRHRATELVTRELGHQSEIELQAKLQNEVEAERLTRLDKILLIEQRERGVIDLRPGEGASWLVRENRNLMIGWFKHLERYGLATELEPGRWTVSDRAEVTLKDLGDRSEV